MESVSRKSLLYKSAVEYGDYTVNHVLGCSHGCKYPCYAYLMARRFGRVENFEEWCQPKIVSNAEELLDKELPRLRDKIHSVHLCFTTDPFMFGYTDVSNLSIRMIKKINSFGIPCTALTKGILPIDLIDTEKTNSYGITLISLSEDFREKYESGSATYRDRISALERLHKEGHNAWVSIEPYPTPNILQQSFADILDRVSFANKIIFGRLNYNPLVSKYPSYKQYFNELATETIEFCTRRNIQYHIKNGTQTEMPSEYRK